MKVNVTYWCKASLRPGDVADLPDAVAQALIRDNHATAADGQPEVPAGEPASPAPHSDTESAAQKARRGRLPVPHKHEPKPDDGE